MKDFDIWEQAYKHQDMARFNGSPEGILWLKVKDLSRHLPTIAEQMGIQLISSGSRAQTQEFYSRLMEMPMLRDKFETCRLTYLRNLAPSWVSTLPTSLQEVEDYDWVNHYIPSLDRYFTANYLSQFPSFSSLETMKEKIAEESWHYIQNAWYDYWTHACILQLFFSHPRVTPSIGTLRGIDFFIDDCPMKLKLLYFPKTFWEAKKQANKDCTLSEIIENPVELMEWLYTEQCRLRFGAENRLFLVFTDFNDPDASWQLKREKDLLTEKIAGYLTHLEVEKLSPISFQFGGQTYRPIASALFILKD